MYLRWRVLFWTLVLNSLINISIGATDHSYPKSGGLSGSDHHGYPSSGGLSGDNRGYPSSGGNYGYPTSGGSNVYPPSGGNYGYPTTGGRYNSSVGSNRYPNTVGSNMGYPPTGGQYNSSAGRYNSTGGRYNSSTGIHNYTRSGGKYEYSTSRSNDLHSSPGGKNIHTGNKSTPVKIHTPLPKKQITYTTAANNEYRYTPPKTIKYIPPGGGPPVLYPVYQSRPPGYVYEVMDSGSKYGTLVTGLALMNLGALADRAYDHSSNNPDYKIKPGEICLFGVKNSTGHYEEFKIDCTFMTTFVTHHDVTSPNTVTTTTVTNVTMVNTVNGVPAMAPSSSIPGNVLYAMLPNGTLVPVNTTSGIPSTNLNNTMTSLVTTTITNTTVVNALDVKGDPIEVMTGMKCYVIRVTGNLRTKKALSCRLLETYAERSIQKNSAIRNGPVFTILIVLFSVYFIY